MIYNAGEIIELAVRRQNVNISELSKQLNVNRRTLYNWFRQKKLHTDIILEIGKAINYDFSNDFEGELICFGHNEAPNLSQKDDNFNSNSTVYYWMQKYIALLEDYKRLVRKQDIQNIFSLITFYFCGN